MATHSSILAWRIPWTEGPGGLQSVGSQRIGHDRMTKHSTAHVDPEGQASSSACHLCVLYMGASHLPF